MMLKQIPPTQSPSPQGPQPATLWWQEPCGHAIINKEQEGRAGDTCPTVTALQRPLVHNNPYDNSLSQDSTLKPVSHGHVYP